MTENEISKIVFDLCVTIHKQYGPGLFESVYEEIFSYELSKAGIFLLANKEFLWFMRK
jgi:GxxExxY protein